MIYTVSAPKSWLKQYSYFHYVTLTVHNYENLEHSGNEGTYSDEEVSFVIPLSVCPSASVNVWHGNMFISDL